VSDLSFLGDGSSDSLSPGEGNQRLGALSDDKHIGRTGGEGVSGEILDVGNVKASRVLFLGGDDSNSSQVVSSGDHNQVSDLELGKVGDLSGLDVDFDGIVDLDEGVRVSDGSSIVETNGGDSLVSKIDSLNLAELELGLLGGDLLDGESSLHVIQQSEVSISNFVDGDDVHESSREGVVSSNLSVDSDNSLLEDHGDLSGSESVSQSVSQKENQWEALSRLVWSRSGSRSKNSRQFVEHPVSGSCESLQMLLGSTSHL